MARPRYPSTVKGSWMLRYEYRGSKLTIPELAELSGIKVQTLRKRLLAGWTVVRAMNVPVRSYKRED